MLVCSSGGVGVVEVGINEVRGGGSCDASKGGVLVAANIEKVDGGGVGVDVRGGVPDETKDAKSSDAGGDRAGFSVPENCIVISTEVGVTSPLGVSVGSVDPPGFTSAFDAIGNPCDETVVGCSRAGDGLSLSSLIGADSLGGLVVVDKDEKALDKLEKLASVVGMLLSFATSGEAFTTGEAKALESEVGATVGVWLTGSG